MPWQEVTPMSQRKEFIHLAQQEEANISRLCSYFQVSRKTAHKWLGRYRQEGEAGLADRSRRPRSSPGATPVALERCSGYGRRTRPGAAARCELVCWPLNIKPCPQPVLSLRFCAAMAASTRKSRRNTRLGSDLRPRPPNDLWQMDFKGHFALDQGRCHPLTVLDDHSRYALGLEACANERGATVQERLTGIFRRYGLPRKMLMDNGSPWGGDAAHPYTPLTVWLLKLGVKVGHSGSYHPQTLGKDERFHRTLKAEVLQYCRGWSWGSASGGLRSGD